MCQHSTHYDQAEVIGHTHYHIIVTNPWSTGRVTTLWNMS